MAKTRVLQLALELKDGTGRGVASFDSNMRKADRASRRATSSFDKLNNSLRNMLGLFAGAAATQGIISYINSWQRLTNQLRTVTDTNEELLRSQRDLFRISQETRQSLEATAAVYTRLSRAQSNLNVTSEEVVTLVTLINKAVATTGATTKEAEAGIIQLSQAFQSGQLAGDELRSVMENLPFIAQAISEGLGIPFREFRRQASKLQVEDLAKGLLNSADLINERFARTQKTFQQGFTILRNEMIKFFGEADDGLTITNAMGEAMAQLGKNLDKVADAFTKLAYTIGAFMGSKAVVGLLRFLTTVAKVKAAAIGVGAIGASYVAGTYAREQVNEFTGRERFIDFDQPFINQAKYFENFNKILELEQKGREVGWEKVNYNLDQQLGILNSIKRAFFGGERVELGADYRAVDYKKAVADGLNVRKTEDLVDEGTITGGKILTSDIIKIAMNNLPKAFKTIREYLKGLLKELTGDFIYYTANLVDEVDIKAKKAGLFVLDLVDKIAGIIKLFFDYWGKTVGLLIGDASKYMFSESQVEGLKNYQKDTNKIREFFGGDFTSDQRAKINEGIKKAEKRLANRAAPEQADGLVETFIKSFKKEIDQAIKSGIDKTGPTAFAKESRGLFQALFEDVVGAFTGGTGKEAAFVKNLDLIKIGLSGTGGELEKLSGKFIGVYEGLSKAYSQYGAAGLFAVGTNFFIKQMNKLSETVTLVARDIEENARRINSSRSAFAGTQRADFLDNYQQRLDDYRPIEQNVLLRDLERLRNTIEFMNDTSGANVLSYQEDAYDAILGISQGDEISKRQGDLIRKALEEEFGRTFGSRQESVDFIAGLMRDLGFSDLEKYTFGSGLFDDLFSIFQERMDGFGELPKNTFEAAVRWFSNQQTLQNIQGGPQLLALFQEAFSEIANIDFGESDLSLAIEPLKDLTTNQIVQLEEMFVQTRLSAMEDGYNSLADQDQRLAQLYFEQEAIAARTQLRDAYELAGQDTFLQAQALDVFKNTIDSIRVSIQQANAAALQTGESLTGELLGGTQDLDLSSVVDTGPLQTSVSVDDLVSFQIDPFEVSNQLSEFGRVVADGVANFFAGVPTTTVRLIDLIDFDSSEMREAIEQAVSEAIADRRVLGYRG